MGYDDLSRRCLRIFCTKLFTCIRSAMSTCKLLIFAKRQAPKMVEGQDDEEENIGLLRETDLGLEGEEVSRYDTELLKKAKDIVEVRTAKELDKLKVKTTPSRKVKDTILDEEEEWLDKFEADADLELNIPEESDIDFLS